MATHSFWNSWKVWVWILAMVISLFLVIRIDDTGLSHNLKLGSEFSGGTLFQLQLGKPASAQEMGEIRTIVEKRLNPSGIKDVTVSNTGNSIVLAQVAETDPAEVAKLQELLLKQGRFESFLNGKKVFDGGQIVQVVESAQQGYGAHPTGIGDTYQWTLPFLLNDEAARSFTESSFHQCTQVGFADGRPQYECAYTYFFIDRPENAIVIYPAGVRSSDNGKLRANSLAFPDKVTTSSILENSQLQIVELDANGVSPAVVAQIQAFSNVSTIIVPSSVSLADREAIEAATDANVTVVNEVPSSPWIADVSGLRDVIALSPGITGTDPFIADIKDTTPHTFLVIQGTADNANQAKDRLNDLKVLLKSGALPIPIISINKQTVSAAFGEKFLSNVWLMGLLALVGVALVVFIRYRELKLVAPLLIVGLSEVIMILGFAAWAKWNLDLAAMAGILAAVGTGVDSEVIMTDEILQKGEESEGDEKGLAARAKRAFFIVAASASTGIAVMLPLIILGSGIGKLSGFAVTTIAGVLLGILISRPAFQEIIRSILRPKHAEHHAEPPSSN